MKRKLLSLILSIVMVLSAASVLTTMISAADAQSLAATYEAAKDGDLIWDVLFNDTTGIFTPEVLDEGDNHISKDSTITISEDGKTVTFKKAGASATTNPLVWGGYFNGLKVGDGQKYTIDMTIRDINNKQFGIGFTYDSDLDMKSVYTEDGSTRDIQWNNIMSWFGSVNKTATTAAYLGKGITTKLPGKYLCPSSGSSNQNSFAVAANGDPYRFTIEIDDNSFRVFYGGNFWEEVSFSDELVDRANNLGLVFYTRLVNANIEWSNVKLYKGNILSDADGFKFPEPIHPGFTPVAGLTENVLIPDAANGEKILDVNFASGGIFKPVIAEMTTTLADISCVPSADGKSFTFTQTKASGNGQTRWGGEFEGLKLTADSKYTYTFKVKSHNEWLSAIYVLYNTDTGLNRIGFQASLGADPASNKATLVNGTASMLENDDYPVEGVVTDADGFVDVAIELNGYVLSVYVSGNLFASYDLTSEIADTSTQLGFGIYTYRNKSGVTVKDLAVYNGLYCCTTGEVKYENVKEENCTENGYTGDKFCAICGASLGKGEEIPATGHAHGNVILPGAANLVEGNTYYKACACGDMLEETFTLATDMIITDATGDAIGITLVDVDKEADSYKEAIAGYGEEKVVVAYNATLADSALPGKITLTADDGVVEGTWYYLVSYDDAGIISTVSASVTDGKVTFAAVPEGNFVIINSGVNPETGDNTIVYVLALIAVVTLAGATAIVAKKRINVR